MRLPLTRKTLFTGLVSGVVLLVAGVLWGVPFLLDGGRLGRMIAGELANATGQRVRLEGEVRASIFPRARLALNGLKLLALDGQTVLLDVPRVDLDVSLSSLFGGRLAVEDVHFVDPHLFLRRGADGALNWGFSLQQARALSLWHASVHGGRVTLDNNGRAEDITDLAGDFYLPESSTLPVVTLTGDWRQAPFSFSFDVAAPIARAPSPTSVRLEIGAVEAAFRFSGTLDTLAPRFPLQGDVEVHVGQAAALLALGASLGLTSEPPADPALQAPFTLTGALEGEGGSYTLRSLSAALGSQVWTGLARVQTVPRFGVSVAAQANAVDAAAWPSLLAALRTGELHVPVAWLGAFDLTVPSVSLGAVSASDVRLKGDVVSGLVRLAEASATLPGESRVSLAGTLTTKPDALASVDGTVTLDTVRLRDFLAGVGVSLPGGFSDQALRQTKITASVRGPWNAWGVPALQATLDGMTVSGQIGAPESEGGARDVRLSADTLDLGRYASLEDVPAWLWQLPPLRLDVTTKQLRVGDQAAENVTLRATLQPDLLTVASLDTADFGGNRLRLAGSISPPGKPGSDLTLQLTTADFARLRDNFPPASRFVPAPVAPVLSGPVDLSVRWKEADGLRQCLQSLSAGDGKLDLVTTTPADQLPHWKVRLRHRDTAPVLALFAPTALVRPDVVLGPLDLYAEGHAEPDGRWMLEAIQGQVAGLSIRTGALTLRPGVPLQLDDGSLTLASGSLDLWQQTLLPLPLAHLVTGTLGVTIEKLTLLGDPLTKGNASVTLTPEGAITLGTLNGNWRDGTLTLKGTLPSAPDQPLTGEVAARNIAVTLRGGDRFGLKGQLDLSFKFSAAGADGPARLRALEGDGEFSVEDGTISGLDFAALNRELKPRKQGVDSAPLFARGGQATLSVLSGDFTVEEGIAKTSNLRLRTPAATAEGSATLDPSAPRLDVSAQVSLTDLEGAPPFGLTLAGSVSGLVPTFSTEALLRWADASTKPPEPPATAGDSPTGDDAASHGKPTADAAEKTPPAAPEEPTPPPPQEVKGAAPVPASSDDGETPPTREEMMRVEESAPAGRAATVPEQPRRPPVIPRRPVTTAPQITFEQPSSSASPALAPEFQGVAPQPERTAPPRAAATPSAPRLLPDEEDVPPAASADDLMRGTDGLPTAP